MREIYPQFPSIPNQAPKDKIGGGSIASQQEELDQWMSILTQELQHYYGGNGIIVPQLNSSTISELQSKPTTIGTLVFNTDTSELMINKTGTFVNVLTA